MQGGIAAFLQQFGFGSPFDLDRDSAYRAWRESRLERYPDNIEQLIVEIGDPRKLTAVEHDALHERITRCNMAIYAGSTADDPDKGIPFSLGEQFGLTELDNNMGADDGVTSLRVFEGQWRGGYIPYTSRPIHWHTDGYYNVADHQISALLLHCVSPAADGGENALLDHELAYIHLRDTNPDFIRALMAPDAMTIPANIENGVELRAERTGPVFSVLPDGNLHMRYTARTRSIEWRDDPVTRAAVIALTDYLKTSPDVFRATLQPGQGLISNNVLHDRSGFEEDDAHKRLLYRLRYYQRIAGT
jgi:hypothetical protein